MVGNCRTQVGVLICNLAVEIHFLNACCKIGILLHALAAELFAVEDFGGEGGVADAHTPSRCACAGLLDGEAFGFRGQAALEIEPGGGLGKLGAMTNGA